MRILILIDCYLPSYKSGAKQIHDLGVEFRRQGHTVTILTTTHEIARSFEITMEDELRVARVKTRRIKGAPKALRAVNEMRLSAFVWQRAGQFLAENPADLIIFYSPTIFWGSLVRRLKLLWRCPAYLILRDIFPEWAVNAGVLRRGLIYRYLHRKEIQQYDSADVIAVQSPGDLEYFARHLAHQPYRLEVLYNWATLRESNLPQTHYRADLELQNKVVFFYGGNLGVAQDVDNLVRLASSLTSHQEIRFLLVGEGSEAGHLQEAIAEQDLHNIQLLPPVEQRGYISMVSEFDVGLITLDRRLTTHNIPGKLLGYLYWGIPVLASINPGNDLFELLGKSEAGFCLVNGKDEQLRAAAMQLAKSAPLRAHIGENGRRLLERTFSVEAAAQQVLRCMSLPDQSRPFAQTETFATH
jgi:glycosyltransferase involved in cell wall biosynthesis